MSRAMLETARKQLFFPVVLTDPFQFRLRGKVFDFGIRLADGASASAHSRELGKPKPLDLPASCTLLITNVPLLT